MTTAGDARGRTPGGQAINPIVALCLTDHLPPLWTLVVSASIGLGSGYWREHTDAAKIARQEQCFAHYGARRAEPLSRARTARRTPDVVIRETFRSASPSGRRPARASADPHRGPTAR